MPLAQQLIQSQHAVHNAAVRACKEGWQGVTPNVVLFEVANEAQLIRAVREVRATGVKLELFEEPDHALGFTAAATLPIHRYDDARTALTKYELYDAALVVPTAAT